MENRKEKNNRIDQLFYEKLNNFSVEQTEASRQLLQLLQREQKKKKFFTRFSLFSLLGLLVSGALYYCFTSGSDTDNPAEGIHNVKKKEQTQGFFSHQENHTTEVTQTVKDSDEQTIQVQTKKAEITKPFLYPEKKYEPGQFSDVHEGTKTTYSYGNTISTADVFYKNEEVVPKANTYEKITENYLSSIASVIYVRYGQDSIKAVLKNLGKELNSPFADYAPVINADGTLLYFTSRRPVTEKEKKKNKESKEYIYFSSFDAIRKTWSEAQIMPEPINVPGRFNSIIALSNDGQRMLLYRDDEFGNGDIYESVLTGNLWSEPQRLPEPINTKYHESSASISPDGRTIYFVSNRPGGIGGLDIWYATKDINGKWTEARNLGKPVNTEDNEEGIFIHPDGKTIYFSSKGHKGFGGYDVFYSVNRNGVWSQPVNLGSSINTVGNDIYFVMEANGKYAYYSSQRLDGLGEKDIYRVEFIFSEKKKSQGPELTLFKGLILDKKDQRPLEAEIEIIDLEKNQQISLLKSNAYSGQFLISLPSGKNYGINVRKEGYLFYSENMNIPEHATYNEIIKTVLLDRLVAGARVILNNIFYDYDKATLRPESMAELDRLFDLLVRNPNVRVELSSHTDSRGTDSYNNKLSEERARSCVEYLVKKGIDRSRIVAKGYGKQQLLIPDEEIQKLGSDKEKEEAHQKNRRTEIKIIEIEK